MMRCASRVSSGKTLTAGAIGVGAGDGDVGVIGVGDGVGFGNGSGVWEGGVAGGGFALLAPGALDRVGSVTLPRDGTFVEDAGLFCSAASLS